MKDRALQWMGVVTRGAGVELRQEIETEEISEFRVS